MAACEAQHASGHTTCHRPPWCQENTHEGECHTTVCRVDTISCSHGGDFSKVYGLTLYPVLIYPYSDTMLVPLSKSEQDNGYSVSQKVMAFVSEFPLRQIFYGHPQLCSDMSEYNIIF